MNPVADIQRGATWSPITLFSDVKCTSGHTANGSASDSTTCDVERCVSKRHSKRF